MDIEDCAVSTVDARCFIQAQPYHGKVGLDHEVMRLALLRNRLDLHDPGAIGVASARPG